MHGVFIKNDCILFYGNIAGYIEDGKAIVDPMFHCEELKDYGYRQIKKHLESNHIKTVTGKDVWSTSTIDRILSNEKYVGNIISQKTYTKDFLIGKQVKNNGEIPQYFIENNHQPIILKDIFDEVQKEKAKRSLKAKQSLGTLQIQ